MTDTLKSKKIIDKVRKRQLSAIEQCLVDSTSIQNTRDILPPSNNNELFLIQEHSKSQTNLPDSILKEIITHLKKREQNVFDTQIIDQTELTLKYLDGFKRIHLKEQITNLIDTQIQAKHQKIVQQILEGKIKPQNPLHQRPSFQSSNVQSRSNHRKYQSQHSLCPAIEPRSLTIQQLHNIFSLRSTGTKFAAKYIRSKRKQQLEIQQRVQRANSEKLKSLERIKNQERERKEEQAKRKHESLLKLISERASKRQQFKQRQIELDRESEQLKRKEKPLFEKIKQKEEIQMRDEEEKLNSKIKGLKRYLRAIDSSQLSSFQKSYLESKQDKNNKRQLEFQRLRTEEITNTKKYYKSKFHQFVQKPEKKEKQQESMTDQKNRRNRRDQYSKEVKEKIRLVPDQKLKEQLRGLIIEDQKKYKRPKMHKKQRYVDQSNQEGGLSKVEEEQEPNRKQDGLKFLRFAKEKRNKTLEIKKSTILQQPKTQITLNSTQNKSHHLDDHQLLNKFICNVRKSIYSNDSKKDLLRAKANQLDEKAHRSHQLLRLQNGEIHNRNTPNPQQYYIDSIRTKIQLLKL